MPFLVASRRALILAAAAVLAGPIVVPGAGVAANAIAPMMSGDIQTGERLSLASPGLWTIDSAVTPPDEVQVQFQRLVVGGAWADIAGATGPETASYLTTEAADHGTRLRVGVRVRKGSDWSGWAYSRGQRCTKAPLGSWYFSGGSTAAQQMQSFFAAPLGDVAISIAAPAVFTRAAHGRKVGDKVTFHTAGGNKLPDGVRLGGLYFVTAVPTPDTFQVSTTSGGAPIETTGTQVGTHIVSIPTTRLRWVKDGMPDTGWYDQFTYGDSIATKWVDAGLGLEPGNDRTFVVNVPTVCSNPSQAAIPAFQGNAAAPAPTAAQTPITRYDTGSASWVVGSVIVGDHNMSIGYALRNTYQRWAQRTAEAILAVDDAADTITVGSDFYATATDGDRVFFTPGSGGALPGGVAVDSVYYLRKAGSDKIEIYGTPNGAKTANPASKRNITSAGTLPFSITRARFEKADGTPLAVNDTSTPNPYVHAAIKGWTRKLVASSIWGRSDGYKVVKYRGDHEHNGTWYIFQVLPGIEQEWSFNYRYTLETVWSETAAKILADYPAALAAKYGAATPELALVAAKALIRPVFCINKNSPSGALVKDYWPGDDLFAPDPQGRYPAGGFMPDVYNDRWGIKPGIGNDDTNYPTNYLANRAWRKSASRSDKIDYFVKYMVGESLADSVANEWTNKQTNGQALAFTDEFAADQSARVAGPFTVSIGSPAVFTRGAHGFVVGQEIRFTTTGALPTGLTANTVYYVTAIPSKSTFRVSATPGGSDVATSGTQSGTHSIKARAPGRTMDFAMEKGLGEYGGGARLWGANPRGGTGDDEVYLECIHHWMDGTLSAFLVAEAKAPLTHYGADVPALGESGWWGFKEADYKTIACNSTNMPIAYKILAGNGWAQGLVNTYSQIYSDPARHTPGAYVEARASLFNYRDNPPASQSEFPPRLIHEMPDSLAQWFKDWMPESAQAMLVAKQPLPIPNIVIPTSFHLAKGLRNQLPWVMSHGYNDMVEFLVTTGAPTTGTPALGNADLDQNADNIISVDEVDQRGPVAISIGSPAVFTRSGHGLAVGRAVQFSAQAASDTVPSPKLPDGITAGTTYYVVAVPSTSTFQVSETSGGAAIVTSGTQSGTHRVTPSHLYDYNALANKRMTLETGATRFDPYAGANVYEACITTSVNAEAGETIKVVFHDPCNATLNGGTAAVECLATIVDGFVVGDVVVNEDAGVAMLTVSRAASNGLATQVTWRSREVPRQTGSNSLLTPFTAAATAGADFVEASGVLVFGANDLAQTFTVPFTDDALEEGAEEFWVEIGILAGQPGAILDAYAKVRINANDGSALQGWSGLVGHFDAADDASFTLVGPDVTAWKNKVSGQGDLASPFSGNRPTRAVQTYAPYTGGPSLNMPAVVFQTGDSVAQDYMEASALSGVSKAIDGADPDATLIAVMRLTATGFQSMLGWSLNNSTTAGDVKALSLRRSNTNSVNYRTGPADVAPSVVSAPPFPANQLFIVALAKSPDALSLWTVLAGGALAQITGAPGISEVPADIAGTFSGQMFGLGSQRAPATGGSLALDTGITGTIHEVVVSRDRQSDAEIRAVMLELAAKWKFGLA